MAGPVEILIVVGVFGLVGVYLYIASRFLRAGERDAAQPRNPAAETDSHNRQIPLAGTL